MAETARTLATISAEEYLTLESGSAWKHEFVDGVIYAMAGPTDRHAMIAFNLVGLLNAHLPDRCRALGIDVKLRIKSDRVERYYYPDVFVSCGPPLRGAHVYDEAILVVEILSPGTEQVDRTEKLQTYRLLPGLAEYVLIAQDTPRVEIFRRRTDWAPEIFHSDPVLKFESVSLDIPMAQLYRRIEFAAPAASGTAETS